MKCRHCKSELELVFVDLGSAPPSNAYLESDKLRAPETWYPLRVLVCETCWLVQTEDHTGRELLFDDAYAYFSSTSASWLRHAQKYVADMVERFGLGANSMVAEVAANDGYLLQYVNERNIPCFGIEPTGSTAQAARAKGIKIWQQFFGESFATELANTGNRADLIAANNVLAHVPDINDFLKGFSQLLKPDGVATFEFPHLLNLVTQTQFDTIYHEHFSYLSLTAIEAIFKTNTLEVFDVEQLSTHGGSLRVFAQKCGGKHARDPRVDKLRQAEASAGIATRAFYADFQTKVESIKNDTLRFLIETKQKGQKVGAYGAAAKGNTLLNFAGVKADLLPYVVDRATAKQGKFLPGSHLPIVDEQHLMSDQPDWIVILPWNLKSEILEQLDYVRKWGGKFVTFVPNLQKFDLPD